MMDEGHTWTLMSTISPASSVPQNPTASFEVE